MEIKLTIKRLREDFGMNQKQMAKAMGITAASYCRVEGGKDAPTHQFLTKLATATNMRLVVSFVGVDVSIESFSPLVNDKASENPPAKIEAAKKAGWREKIKDGMLTALKEKKS